MNDNGQCQGFQQITALNTAATSLTIPGTPAYSNAALIRVENDIRFRLDGTAPTTSVGMLLKASDTAPFWIEGMGLLQNFKAIGATGSAVIDILYFGAGQ